MVRFRFPRWSRTARATAIAVALVGGLCGVTPMPAAGGTPAAVTSLGSRPPASAEARRSAAAAAHAHPDALHSGPYDSFLAGSTAVDPDGTTHVHLDRTYRGLPVLGGDAIVHIGPDGAFLGATLMQAAPITASTTPMVSAARAVRAARAAFRGDRQRTAVGLAIDEVTSSPALVWHVSIDGLATDGSPSHLQVLVDAGTGATRRVWDSFQTMRRAAPTGSAARSRTAGAAPGRDDGLGHGFQVGDVPIGTTATAGGWELKDPARGAGETRDMQNGSGSGPGVAFTDADGTFGNGLLTDRATVGVDAHFGIRATWDFYADVFGRHGIRDDGAGATSYVHYGVDYANAGWDDSCFCMIYGDGAAGSKPFTAIDVAGHEMSHGVTAATAKLDYFGESGGLNEGNSDIFGTLVEFAAHDPADAPDYTIGEKLDMFGDGRPLRWMDDPSKDGSSATCWTSSVGGLDVHYSSGIANHFFYLLAVGSGRSQWGDSPTCGAPAVTGVGNDHAGRIWYRALTTYMTSSTDYHAARLATLRAAQDLYPGGRECATVNAAWAATAVVGPDPGCAR